MRQQHLIYIRLCTTDTELYPEMRSGVVEWDFYTNNIVNDTHRRRAFFSEILTYDQFVKMIFCLLRPTKYFPSYARADPRERGNGKHRAARYTILDHNLLTSTRYLLKTLYFYYQNTQIDG